MCAGQILICKEVMATFAELQAVLIICMRKSVLLSKDREGYMRRIYGSHRCVAEHASKCHCESV